MGIAIKIDTYLLCNMFNISSKKISDDYVGMSIEEIMKAEAANGNAAAANFDTSILNNPAKLIELFELKDPANKYMILSNMSKDDLDELLPLLSQSDLVAGLNYFSKDKLLKMSEALPKEQLINMTFQMFSPEQVIQNMPEGQLNKVLTSDKMDKSLEIKYLQTMKPEILAQMLEGATGEPLNGETAGGQTVVGAEQLSAQASQGSAEQSSSLSTPRIGMDGQQNLDGKSLAKQITALPDDKFKEAMISIPPQNKRDFMCKLVKEDPKLFLQFDSNSYTKMIDDKKEKVEIVKACKVLEPEQLVKMVSQLPKDLTAAVLTQMETTKFADVLIAKFKNIIGQIMAG